MIRLKPRSSQMQALLLLCMMCLSLAQAPAAHAETFIVRKLQLESLYALPITREKELELRAVAQLAEKQLGEGHPQVLEHRANLGRFLARVGRWPEASRELGQVIAWWVWHLHLGGDRQRMKVQHQVLNNPDVLLDYLEALVQRPLLQLKQQEGAFNALDLLLQRQRAGKHPVVFEPQRRVIYYALRDGHYLAWADGESLRFFWTDRWSAAEDEQALKAELRHSMPGTGWKLRRISLE